MLNFLMERRKQLALEEENNLNDNVPTPEQVNKASDEIDKELDSVKTEEPKEPKEDFLTQEEAAKRISEAISIPTIGIGAGKYTDGQVLVWSDMLGFFQAFQPKFVKRYLEGAALVQTALDAYIKEVQERSFPQTEYTYQK